MRRGILIFFILVKVISTAPDYSNYAPDIRRILEKGELVVAMTSEDMPPFYFVDNNNFVGVDVELAKSIGQALGVEVVFDREAATFDQVIERVFAGDADMGISKLSRTLARSTKVKYTEPYVLFHQALLINRLGLAKELTEVNELTIVKFLKQCNDEVGVLESSSYVNYAKSLFPNAKVVEYASWLEDIVPAVLDGEVLMAYRDELEIKKIIKMYPDASLELETVVLKDQRDEIAIAVAWQDEQLFSWLEVFLAKQNMNLTAESILDDYSFIFE